MAYTKGLPADTRETSGKGELEIMESYQTPISYRATLSSVGTKLGFVIITKSISVQLELYKIVWRKVFLFKASEFQFDN